MAHYRSAGDRPRFYTETLLWQANAADAHARITQETYGNGVFSTRTYHHETGDLQTIQTGTAANPSGLQNVSYTFDALGNLRSRNDAITGLSETFDYDTLNRLIRATNSGASSLVKTYSYDAAGNLTYKSDLGTYSYNPPGPNSVRPHAVSSISGAVNATYTYDANGNLTSGGGRSITWTPFNKPYSLTQGGATTTINYDADFNRLRKITPTRTTIYVGRLYEKVTSGTLIEHKHYIYGGSSLVAIYTARNNGTEDTKYVHTDHLGSINVITNDNAQVIERLSYDPHGRRRQTNGQDATGPITSSLNRGFTRHEHDEEAGLINMNARLYDPLLGRFISADPIVPYAGDSQAYNRYSYVDSVGIVPGPELNTYLYARANPLRWIDPKGLEASTPGTPQSPTPAGPGSQGQSGGSSQYDPRDPGCEAQCFSNEFKKCLFGVGGLCGAFCAVTTAAVPVAIVCGVGCSCNGAYACYELSDRYCRGACNK